MAENGTGTDRVDRRLAELAAERHPEAYAAELPENWAGHDVDMVFYPAEVAAFSARR